MPGKTTIIIVRHGETEENIAGIVQGQTDGTLSEHGIKQARDASEALADTHIDVAYSSDLGRALDTAKVILDGRDGIELIPDQRLREQDLGVFTGGPVSDYTSAMEQEGVIRERFDPEGGEASGRMRERVRSFIEDMGHRHAGGAVLVVTHQGAIRMMADILGIETAARHAEPVALQIGGSE